MKKNKTKEEIVRQLTPEELVEEEKKYQACKKPVKIGWAIYTFAATLYLCSGFFAKAAADKIPQKPPITESLSDYKNHAEYKDFISETQKVALNQLINGEITVDEYDYIIKTTKSDESFEEFLRNIENDERVQKVITAYDEYASEMNSIIKKHSALSITALSSLLVATAILAKYRLRELDIEDARKKRAEAENNFEGPQQY